jgi:hypothetical protein
VMLVSSTVAVCLSSVPRIRTNAPVYPLIEETKLR